MSLRTVLLEKWKISLIVIVSCFTIAYALGLYFHSGESFALDFSEGEIKRFIPLKKGDELKFYFKVPEDGFSGLDVKLKSAKKEPNFSAQIILRKLYKQSIVIQEIVSSDNISKDGFLKLRFNSLIFSRGTEFELTINPQSSPIGTNLEFIVIASDNSIQSLPTIYNTSLLEGSLPLRLHFTRSLFIWRLLLNNAYILLILTTILSFLLFRALPERYRYHWAIIYFSILLMLPTYVIISPDEEGFYNSLADAILKSRALAEGNLPFWNSFHGIGMPYNTMSSINWHPVWLLLDKIPLSVNVAILYHLHTFIALLSMFALARLIGLRKPSALLCAITYSCSTQAITYIFGENFWPAGMIPITLMPAILFFLIKFLFAEDSSKKFLYCLLTGSSFGFMVLNTHLGMVLFLAISVSFYLAMNWRRLVARWPWVLLLGFLILLIATPRLADLFEELRRYTDADNYVRHYVKFDFLGIFLWPFIKVDRGLAFGGPFFLLSLIGIFWPGLKSVHRAAFSVSIMGCYAVYFVPPNFLLPANFGTSHFVIIFSVLMAGLVAEQLLNNFPQHKRWIVAFCFLQAVLVLSGATDYWHPNAKKSIDYVQNKKVKVLKVAFSTSPLTKAIETFDKGQGGRSYFTHEAEKVLMRKLVFGYHFESLPLNGFRILNGRFNGIDYSDVHSNRAYMKAHLVGSKRTLFNKALLDILGIKYIFADFNESVLSGLVPVTLLPGPKSRTITMYTNPSAWPDAVVVKDETRSLQPSPEGGSNDKGLLFYDFKPLLGMREMEDPVTTKRDHGSIILRLEPSSKMRTVMVSEYFRPGWKAEWRSAEGLIETSVFPIFGHLVGIEVPEGAAEIRLSYAPALKLVLWSISIGTFFLSVSSALIIWVWSFRQGRYPGNNH